VCRQAAAIVAEGLKHGTRCHRSVTLGVAAQFELTMRQVNVIGVWERLEQAEPVEAGAIVRRGRIWRPGWRFEDFAAGRLDLETSKKMDVRCLTRPRTRSFSRRLGPCRRQSDTVHWLLTKAVDP
jgi:hypothetical protein